MAHKTKTSIKPTPLNALNINNVRVPVSIDPVTGEAFLCGWDARWYYGDRQKEVDSQLRKIEKENR